MLYPRRMVHSEGSASESAKCSGRETLIMADTTVTIVGNITGDPELRFTPNGVPVGNFSVAVNARTFVNGEWKDGDVSFFRVNVWRGLAENCADSLRKGNRVIVTGTLIQRSWEDNEGNNRTVVEITASEVGPSLKWATAEPKRNARSDREDDESENGGPSRKPARSGSSRSPRGRETRARKGGDFDEPMPE